jgi:uncharacterized membrane protein (DUF485 family)
MEASTQQGGAGPDVDWEEIERSPEFQELVKKRKAFVLPGTVFYLAWYMGFILLVAYAEDFMSRRVYEGLTVGYCLALTQFVMVLVLGLLYLRKADHEFDPLAEKAIAKYSGQRERFTQTEADSRTAAPTTEVER